MPKIGAVSWLLSSYSIYYFQNFEWLMKRTVHEKKCNLIALSPLVITLVIGSIGSLWLQDTKTISNHL